MQVLYLRYFCISRTCPLTARISVKAFSKRAQASPALPEPDAILASPSTRSSRFAIRCSWSSRVGNSHQAPLPTPAAAPALAVSLRRSGVSFAARAFPALLARWLAAAWSTPHGRSRALALWPSLEQCCRGATGSPASLWGPKARHRRREGRRLRRISQRRRERRAARAAARPRADQMLQSPRDTGRTRSTGCRPAVGAPSCSASDCRARRAVHPPVPPARSVPLQPRANHRPGGKLRNLDTNASPPVPDETQVITAVRERDEARERFEDLQRRVAALGLQ